MSQELGVILITQGIWVIGQEHLMIFSMILMTLRRMMRQVMGAVAEFEKNKLVSSAWGCPEKNS